MLNIARAAVVVVALAAGACGTEATTQAPSPTVSESEDRMMEEPEDKMEK